MVEFDSKNWYSDPRILYSTIRLYDAPTGHGYFDVTNKGNLDPQVQTLIDELAKVWREVRPRETVVSKNADA